MGKISKVEYKEINEKDYTTEELAEYYYLFNVLNLDNSFMYEAEEYDSKQYDIRNKYLKDLKDNGKDIISRTSIVALSSLKNKPVIVVNSN